MNDLKFKEAKELLRVSKTHLLTMLADGKLPNAYKIGARWRIPMCDIEALKKRRQVS